MRKAVGGNLFGVAIAVGAVVIVNTVASDEALHGLTFDPLTLTKCESSPGGFYWRSEDVPQALKQSVPTCWTYADGVDARRTETRVTVDSALQEILLRLRTTPLQGSEVVPDEALPPGAPGDRQ